MALGSFDPRHPSESYPLSFDFSALLTEGEEITGVTFSVALVDDGVDPDLASRLVGGATFAAGICSQRFTGGVAGVTYLLTAVAVTDADNIYELCGYVPIVAC